MDFQKILRIIQSFEDGALTNEEAVELLDGIIFILEKIRPQLKKWFLRIVLDGVKVSLSELKEHLHDQKEN
jgi:hypothetical protein